MKNYIKIILAIIIDVVLTYLFLLSGFWYGLIIAGFIPTILIQHNAAKIYITIFLSSILGTIIFMIPLLMDNLSKLMYYVGIIAGINGTLLLSLIFIFSGILGLSGSLIGNYFRDYINSKKNTTVSQI